MKNRASFVVTAIALILFRTATLRLVGQENNIKHHHYKLIDLGTLGGPNAWATYPLPGEVQLNQRGMVEGVSDTPDPDPYYPKCLVDCNLVHAYRWQNGVLTDLGALPGSNDSWTFSSNNRGQIVGVSENSEIDGDWFSGGCRCPLERRENH